MVRFLAGGFSAIFFERLIKTRIKSLGASRKKPPEVCLDQCIEYSQHLREEESGGQNGREFGGTTVASVPVNGHCNLWINW